MLLKVKEISKEYEKGVKALSKVSFSVEKGEFLSVIGPSGSGKSTLLRCINRIVDTTEGEIIFEKSHVEKLRKSEIKRVRRQIGMIFQSYNLVEKLTVIENVLHGRLGYKSILSGVLGIYTEEEKKEAFEILEKVDMGKYAYQRCSNLSGGQKQRVGIARALMQKPILLLCDEPTGALDYQTGKAILKLLQDMCRQKGMTVIVITHNSALTPMADRVIHIKNGTVSAMEMNEHPTPVEEIEW